MIDTPWPAPAKINRFLHITGRREDGYHELQTLFQFLDIADDLWFDIRNDNKIRRYTDIDGVPEQDDLIIKAAHKLREYAGQDLGVDITIDKKLPMGGGIGGGSSDAATTLVALNKLWDLNLPSEVLSEIGLELGADIPFFVHGQTAWAEGVGENLQSINIDKPWFLLVHPGIHISTAEIFSNSQLTRDTSPIRMLTFVTGDGHNDCEPIVRSSYSEVEKVFDWFGSDSQARLTGTGACVFCPYPDKDAAKKAARSLPKHWTGFVVKGLNRSPLMERLAKEKE